MCECAKLLNIGLNNWNFSDMFVQLLSELSLSILACLLLVYWLIYYLINELLDIMNDSVLLTMPADYCFVFHL